MPLLEDWRGSAVRIRGTFNTLLEMLEILRNLPTHSEDKKAFNTLLEMPLRSGCISAEPSSANFFQYSIRDAQLVPLGLDLRQPPPFNTLLEMLERRLEEEILPVLELSILY